MPTTIQKEVEGKESGDMAILITISNGFIEQVKICKDSLPPVNIVSDFVQTMNMEDMNVAFKGDGELLINCEQFLNGNSKYIRRFAD